MNVLVTLDCRFDRTPDGTVWARSQFAYPFWARYLEAFDGVCVGARVRDVGEPPAGGRQVNGPGVSIAPVPYFIGPWQYLLRALAVRRAVRQAVQPRDAIILRVGSQLANLLGPGLRAAQRPYAVEVVGDPYDVFAPGSVKHPLRPLFRWYFPYRLRQLCASAAAAAYVTEDALQRRYPPAPGSYAIGCSDVELPAGAFVAAPRLAPRASGPFNLLFVGTLAQLYKAPDVLIDAVGCGVRDGADLRLVVVGDGKHRPELAARVHRLGIGERVRFLGELPAGPAVREQMDQADLFVLPSRQEGLPRALVEAMARSLPCIASPVGGVPELLPGEDLLPPGCSRSLASKIREVLGDPDRRQRMGRRNWARARDYRDSVLQPRRLEFYRQVRAVTTNWLQKGAELCTVC